MKAIHKRNVSNLILIYFVISTLQTIHAQNPLITDQFTADPSARVFEGKVYVYPSHDIPCGPNQGTIGFCMADYHVFSSENLCDWKDHGVILDQNKVPWVDSTSYTMWAPDCIFKDGKYYFYFPAVEKNKPREKSRKIGVATSDTPFGPFIPEEKPIEGIFGIDPNPFIDRDGKPYLYWAGRGKLMVAGLSDDMLQVTTELRTIDELPPGFKEGPYMFERNGIYYFTFPYKTKSDSTEKLAYATGSSPMGPFTYQGVFMDESPTACWTNHQSIIEYNKQWYLFYHHNDLSPEFDKNRSIKADSLFFNEDGTIVKVNPTLRGIGISNASGKIQIDRYSSCSEAGVSLSYLDDSQKLLGWKVSLSGDAWIRYNRVSFVGLNPASVKVKCMTDRGGVISIRLDKPDGAVIAILQVPESKSWEIHNTLLKEIPAGIHDLFISSDTSANIEIDWISFE
jgi:hypothetical protein